MLGPMLADCSTEVGQNWAMLAQGWPGVNPNWKQWPNRGPIGECQVRFGRRRLNVIGRKRSRRGARGAEVDRDAARTHGPEHGSDGKKHSLLSLPGAGINAKGMDLGPSPCPGRPLQGTPCPQCDLSSPPKGTQCCSQNLAASPGRFVHASAPHIFCAAAPCAAVTRAGRVRQRLGIHDVLHRDAHLRANIAVPTKRAHSKGGTAIDALKSALGASYGGSL